MILITRFYYAIFFYTFLIVNNSVLPYRLRLTVLWPENFFMFKKTTLKYFFKVKSIPWVLGLLVENAVSSVKMFKGVYFISKVFFQLIKMFTTWTKSFCVCLTSYRWVGECVSWVSEWLGIVIPFEGSAVMQSESELESIVLWCCVENTTPQGHTRTAI